MVLFQPFIADWFLAISQQLSTFSRISTSLPPATQNPTIITNKQLLLSFECKVRSAKKEGGRWSHDRIVRYSIQNKVRKIQTDLQQHSFEVIDDCLGVNQKRDESTVPWRIYFLSATAMPQSDRESFSSAACPLLFIATTGTQACFRHDHDQPLNRCQSSFLNPSKSVSILLGRPIAPISPILHELHEEREDLKEIRGNLRR